MSRIGDVSFYAQQGGGATEKIIEFSVKIEFLYT